MLPSPDQVRWTAKVNDAEFSTFIESILGALFQQKFSWLGNEMINAIQTAIAAFLAISIGSIYII